MNSPTRSIFGSAQSVSGLDRGRTRRAGGPRAAAPGRIVASGEAGLALTRVIHGRDTREGLIGRPELAHDERDATRFDRDQRAPELNALLGEWTATQSNSEVAQRLQAEHIPSGPYLDLEQVAASPQYAHRAFFQQLDHSVAGPAAYPTVGYRLSETPWWVEQAAPRLGADTAEILRTRLGRTSRDLAARRAARISESGTVPASAEPGVTHDG